MKKIIFKFRSKLYTPIKDLTGFIWDNFKQGDRVYYEDVIQDGSICVFEKQTPSAVYLFFESGNDSGIKTFLENVNEFYPKVTSAEITDLPKYGSKNAEYVGSVSVCLYFEDGGHMYKTYTGEFSQRDINEMKTPEFYNA